MGGRAEALVSWRLTAQTADRFGFVGALALVGGLAVLDANVDTDRIVTAAVVLGPLLAGLVCSARRTLVVAGAAVVAALFSAVLHDRATDLNQPLDEAVVVVGSAFAVLSARRGERNTALVSDLAAAERRLGAALGGLDAAVMIQRPGEGIVYANPAAAAEMGMSTPEEVVAATPEQIAEGWETFNEDGTPLLAHQYPSRRLLLGERSVGPLVVRTVNRRTGREFWRIVKASPILGEDGELVMAVSVTEDITEIKRAELAQRLLAQAGEALSSSLDHARALQEMARLAVPELADWCTVSLAGEDGLVRLEAVAHVDPGKAEFARQYAERFSDRTSTTMGILRGGPSQLMPELPEERLAELVPDAERLAMLRALGIRSLVQVPLVAPGSGPVGVLTLVNAESGRVFGPADLVLAEELGRRTGVAVHNARLYAERSRIAETLQASLLPEALPDLPGFALASAYRPAEHEVGGDFYDAFAVQGGWMIVVGDVAGRGVQAAALTSQARHTLRAIGTATGDPGAAVAHLNELLVARRSLLLCTVCVVRLADAGAGTAIADIICAGHPLPVLVSGGRGEQVGRWGRTLGAWATTFPGTRVVLRPGDVLVLYTDGVIDARDGRRFFGEERLCATVAGAAGAGDAVRRVEAALDAFQTGAQADDTALLAVERLAVPAGQATGATARSRRAP